MTRLASCDMGRPICGVPAGEVSISSARVDDPGRELSKMTVDVVDDWWTDVVL